MEVRMHLVTNSVRRGAPVVVLAAAAISLSACGSGSSQSDLARARQAGASEQAQKAAQSSMAAELQKLKAQASAKAATPVPAPVSTPPTVVVPAPAPVPVPVPVPVPNVGASCGGNLSVGGNTSCAFGQSVESEYYYEGGGTRTITAYSPVTSTYYSMYCVGGVPTVCTGGNNATVYIR